MQNNVSLLLKRNVAVIARSRRNARPFVLRKKPCHHSRLLLWWDKRQTHHHRQDIQPVSLAMPDEEVIAEWDCKKAPDSATFVHADKAPIRPIEELQHETLALLGHHSQEDGPASDV